METTPGKRVRQFREAKGYKTASAFADAAGLKVATLSSIETDRTSPSFDILATLANAFPDLNTDWLITGTGPMLRDGRNLTPVEAPALTPDRISQTPVARRSGEIEQVAIATGSGFDAALLQEVKDSRDKAWDAAAVARRDAERAWQVAEQWRTLYMQELGQDTTNPSYQPTPEPVGKEEVNSYAAEVVREWIGGQHRDPETGAFRLVGGKQVTENAECVVRLLTPFTNPFLTLAIDETPADEMDELYFSKQA